MGLTKSEGKRTDYDHETVHSQLMKIGGAVRLIIWIDGRGRLELQTLAEIDELREILKEVETDVKLVAKEPK